MKNVKAIEKEIKSMRWDNRVQRTGFLQSKVIVNEAEMQTVYLTPKVKVKSNNIFWIKESNLYDQDFMDKLPIYFEKAFSQDKNWPVKIVDNFNDLSARKDKLVKRLNKNWRFVPNKEKISAFKDYVQLLKDTQKHYIFAAPLTDYCEKQIKNSDEKLLGFAIPIKKLDVDKMSESIVKIKKTQNKRERELLIKKHLKKYEWIKTAYNIIEKYSSDDVRGELKNIKINGGKNKKINHKKNYLLVALQAGIYLRNRIKELSQQIWFAFEPLGQNLAEDLDVVRDDFFQLTPQEVLSSLKEGKCVADKKTIDERHKGFIMGIFHGKEIILTGKIANDLHAYFNRADTKNIKEIAGSIASSGKYKGKVKIILKKSEFGKLKKGDILVTSMTTPDFVVIMKQAGAIITDEGGLSCHAAIVSRELGVPCIIGTKIATKVLKDGDLVEVDANKGIVKILKFLKRNAR